VKAAARTIRYVPTRLLEGAIVTGEQGTAKHRYDAIVVGARCAGAPTAMLLARKGYDVLLVDRAHFPSDTVSTHLIHPPGVDLLRRWGLLDALVATGCPPIGSYAFDFGPVAITGTPRSRQGSDVAYCARRTVLDALLVDAAARAGAEVREGLSVQDVIVDDGTVTGIRGRADGSAVTEYARVVIGADGVHSRVAEAVGARSYREGPILAAAYYAYWSGFPVAESRWVIRPGRAFWSVPTNDGLTLLLAAWPYPDQPRIKADLQRNYVQAVTGAVGERLDGARRESRVVGAGVPNRFRTPYGPGWALVGDAGYAKEPATAQGITDAFHDAELCAEAVDGLMSATRALDNTMAAYQRRRDERALPMYEFTNQIGSLQPPPPEFGKLLGTISANRPAMDGFVSMFAGALSPREFFDSLRDLGPTTGG
jgi:flavin-dependent dehydrogenase